MYIVPGGLIAVGLDIDPSLTTKDKLVGNVKFPNQSIYFFRLSDYLVNYLMYIKKLTLDISFYKNILVINKQEKLHILLKMKNF